MFNVLDEVCVPTKGTVHSACIDLRARIDVSIPVGETVLVPLGVKIDLYKNNELFIYNDIESFKATHYLQLMLRSGLGKKGLILPNGVGVIDLDYKDEIMMIIHNPLKTDIYDEHDGTGKEFIPLNENFEIEKGDRVGQITLLEHKNHLFGIKTQTTRTGGFGHTGIK